MTNCRLNAPRGTSRPERSATMNHHEIDDVLRDGVAQLDAPFLIGAIGDANGVIWQGTAGQASATRPAATDTMLRLFSLTKPIGSFAALLAIDRGLLSLDTPVVSVVPEFSDIQVLVTMGPDGPVLRPPRTQVTLRHLLTHTSGFAYPSTNDEQSLYNKVMGAPGPLAPSLESMKYPLMFDPGTRWEYGIGIDWAGLMVQRADGRRIDRFCHEEIFVPVGMTDTMFEIDGHRDRLADVWLRDEDGGFADFGELAPPSQPDIYKMGHSLFSTASDYLKFLRMVLSRGTVDGVPLISDETATLMMANQIESLRVLKMVSNTVMEVDLDYFPDIRKTWTTAFMRNEADVPGMRAAGSLSWAGYTNLYGWVDPVNGIAGVLMSQCLPLHSVRFMALYERFERVVYRSLQT